MKKDIVSFEGVHCANCSAPMQGEFCHECGQSIHTVLRPMHHMVEDTLDMVLHVDGRVIHTLPPLFLKPGFLTLEYFAGRRQRYVAPFRLMFVLALLAFFACHLAVGNYDPLHFGNESSAGTGAFGQDNTAEAVHAHFEQMRQDIEKSKGQGDQKGKRYNQLITAERDHANHRLVELHAPPMPEVLMDDDMTSMTINIPWLPAAINQSLDRSRARFVANVQEMRTGGDRAKVAEERVIGSVFHALPQTLFVLMPLFALLLKFTYLFKRRLYMEHLIVALHSHAFLFLSLLLGMLLYGLYGWAVPHAAWLGLPLRLLGWALVIWSLAYLFLMQKRVYRQGRFMTTVKYLFIGWCYSIMAAVAFAFAAVLGMTN
ncbi:DUF3667 domain-containing protein [Dyella japonica]|uniref:DUF3667 domain-containing protein n=1 Tax=Dyella japonica A8 TaxID=1217721 RepID=A0A075K774_9GAMM|nr:DUF3667 domain-containing protein [Dyella japonica]AIF49492.1 hypothetical protein HY57_20615 [Dyella japonica A8]